MGKPVGNDKDSLKMTYPRVFGLEKSRDLAEKAVDEAVGALETLQGDTSFLQAAARYSLARQA
jgi:geranylgeranyl diphosphate synthase type II